MTTVEDITRAQVLTLFSRCGNDVPTLLRTVGRCLQEIGRTDVRVEADNNGTFVCVSQNAAYAKRTSVFQQEVEGLAAQAKATVASFKQASPYPVPATAGAVKPPGVPPLVTVPPLPTAVSSQPLPVGIGSAASPLVGATAPHASNVGIPAIASAQIPYSAAPQTSAVASPLPNQCVTPLPAYPPAAAPAAPISTAAPSQYQVSTAPVQTIPLAASTTAAAPASVLVPAASASSQPPAAVEQKQSKRSSSAKSKCFPAESQRDYPTSNYNGNYQLRRFGGDFPSHCNYGFYRRYGTEGKGAASAEFHNSPGGARPSRSSLY